MQLRDSGNQNSAAADVRTPFWEGTAPAGRTAPLLALCGAAERTGAGANEAAAARAGAAGGATPWPAPLTLLPAAAAAATPATPAPAPAPAALAPISWALRQLAP